jgi:hypothetical protein
VSHLLERVLPTSELVYHTLYGITLASDKVIPGIGAHHGADAQIRLHTRALPGWLNTTVLDSAMQIYPASDTDASLVVRRIPEGPAYHFEYDDGACFVVSNDAGNVWVDWPASTTFQSVSMYLLGPIMSWILRLRGTSCLHGSVVAISGRAVVLMGSEGAGKSTTAAALAKRGIAILSDDLAPIVTNGALRIHAGYPALRLWPDSAHALFERAALAPLAPGWDKLGLDLRRNGLAFGEGALPAGAIYILADRSDAEDAPRIEDVSPRDALLALVANSAAGPLLDTRMRAEELALAGRIVREVPVRRLVPHASQARLPELCDILLRDACRLIP